MLSRTCCIVVAIVMDLYCHPALSQLRQGPLPDTLAEVGSRTVTGEDLLDRLELMPWLGKEKKGQLDSLKIRALQSLVAEQLLSLEAPVANLGDDSLSMLRNKTLEHLLVRDELYKREIISRISVSPREVLRGLRRYPEDVRVLLIAPGSEGECRNAWKQLKGSRDIDSMLRLPPTPSTKRRVTLTISFGDLDTALENVVYSLNTGNRLSSPINSVKYGWAIVYFLQRLTNQESAQKSLAERQHAVEVKIRQRKEVLAARTYEGGVLSSKKAVANEKLFNAFGRALLLIMRGDSAGHRLKGKFIITGADLDSLMKLFWSQRNEQFVEMEGGGLTVGELIEGFRNQKFFFPSLDEDPFLNDLNGSIKILVQGEFMAREGLAKNLQHSKDVVHDLSMWSDFGLARALEQKIIQGVTVSEQEVTAYLISHAKILGKPFEVNVREILTDSLEALEGILTELNTGKKMEDLARRFSKRPVWSRRGGESGYFNVSDRPELGFSALEQDTGMIAGPIRLPEGYSLFTVLGKRVSASDTIPSFAALKNTVRNVIASQKAQQILNQYIASLARKYPVRMHYDNLKKVTITPTNMFTTRYLGFGGVMLAVPVIVPQWQWVKEVQDMKGILP